MSTTTKCKAIYLAKSFAIYSLVSAGLILGAKVMLAQEANSRTIIISPPTISERFDPGTKKEGYMKITNTSPTDTLNFKAVIRDFIVEDTKGTPLVNVDFGADKQKYAASSWIGVYPNEFALAPGQTQEITYYIQVPADARPGGRYAAVVYEPQERIDVRGTGTGVETHVGSLFVFRVNGDIVENAAVSRFVPEKSFWEYGPVTINTQIKNLSDSHVKPIGTITIKNLIGQVVATERLTENNIFPEAARDYATTLGNKFMVGPFTAELNATYGDLNDKTLFATASFFVLPWKIAALLVLAIVVIILLIIYLRRRKKHTHHAQTPPPTPPPAQPAPPPPVV